MASKKKPTTKPAAKPKTKKPKAQKPKAKPAELSATTFAGTVGLLEAGPKTASPQATLRLQVVRDGASTTSVEHFIQGHLVEVIPDAELTPGPAIRMLNPGSNTLIWRGAFIADGEADLHVLLTGPSGAVLHDQHESAKRPPIKDVFGKLVL